MGYPVRSRKANEHWPRTVRHVATVDYSEELGVVDGGDEKDRARLYRLMNKFIHDHGVRQGDLQAHGLFCDPDFDPVELGLPAGTESPFYMKLTAYAAVVLYEEDAEGELVKKEVRRVDIDNTFHMPGKKGVWLDNFSRALYFTLRHELFDGRRVLGFSLNELEDGKHSLYIHVMSGSNRLERYVPPKDGRFGTPLLRNLYMCPWVPDREENNHLSLGLSDAERDALDYDGYLRWRVRNVEVDQIREVDLPAWQEMRQERGLHTDIELALDEYFGTVPEPPPVQGAPQTQTSASQPVVAGPSSRADAAVLESLRSSCAAVSAQVSSGRRMGPAR